MRRFIKKTSAGEERESSILERPHVWKATGLTLLALGGMAWTLAGKSEAATRLKDNAGQSATPQKSSKNKFPMPSEGSYLKLPRYKKYVSAVDARNNILSQFVADETSLSPLPNLNKYDKEFYNSCVYGKLRYPVSYENGVSNSGRIDEDTVGMDIFSVDDCWGKYRDSRTIIGLEARENSKEEFEPAEIAPGIIKRFGSSPEYGSYYAGKFNVGESCKDNPDLQVRFTIENVTRGNYLPLVIRVRPEKNMDVITCAL